MKAPGTSWAPSRPNGALTGHANCATRSQRGRSLTAAGSKAQATDETSQRPRCPVHKTLLDKAGRCVMYDHYPLQKEEKMVVAEDYSKAPVQLEGCEVGGQLMFGILVPRVAVQRKAETEMDEASFNAHRWEFGPGDKLTVVEKDGWLVVKMTTKGEE